MYRLLFFLKKHEAFRG